MSRRLSPEPADHGPAAPASPGDALRQPGQHPRHVCLSCVMLSVMLSVTLSVTCHVACHQNQLIMAQPRQRRQTTRYGNQDSILDMSELDTSDSAADTTPAPDDGAVAMGLGARRRGGRRRRGTRRGRRPREGVERGPGGGAGLENGPIDYYTRSDCFKVEKNLLVYG